MFTNPTASSTSDFKRTSFDITSSDALCELYSDLEALKSKYGQNVSTENGLILRTKVTCSNQRARQLKLKCKRLRRASIPYGSLVTKVKSGRPRADCRYRNRFGRKASNLRKVCIL